MKKYVTEKSVKLASGEVGLTDAQAEPRAGRLKKIKKGVYEITGPIEFKAGEVLYLEKPDKFLMTCLVDPDAEAAAQKEQEGKKAEAQAAKKAAQEEKAAAEAAGNPGANPND